MLTRINLHLSHVNTIFYCLNINPFPTNFFQPKLLYYTVAVREYIFTAIDNALTALILPNFSAALDTIFHAMLLHRLEKWFCDIGNCFRVA